MRYRLLFKYYSTTPLRSSRQSSRKSKTKTWPRNLSTSQTRSSRCPCSLSQLWSKTEISLVRLWFLRAVILISNKSTRLTGHWRRPGSSPISRTKLVPRLMTPGSLTRVLTRMASLQRPQPVKTSQSRWLPSILCGVDSPLCTWVLIKTSKLPGSSLSTKTQTMPVNLSSWLTRARQSLSTQVPILMRAILTVSISLRNTELCGPTPSSTRIQ